MSKGADFERQICKRLSLWWTKEERDDVFWRSSQSGGRATVRHRQGKRTAGSYGDITALDPIGQPLLKMWTIELKRGRSHGRPDDLIDTVSDKQRAFEKCLMQAINAHKVAESISWLVISRADRRESLVYGSLKCLRSFGFITRSLLPCVHYDLFINREDGSSKRLQFFCAPLDVFLCWVTSDDVKRFVHSYKV